MAAQVDLCSGDTRSCGCLRRELRRANNFVHGQTLTRAYRKWQQMWQRVRNTHAEKNAGYARVSVCRRWRRFENFLADMGAPPPGYSLERKSNARGYTPGNCRWIPLAQQAQNTSRTRWLVFAGKRLPLSVHARRQGLPPKAVSDRLNKLGWSVHDALCTPLRKMSVP